MACKAERTRRQHHHHARLWVWRGVIDDNKPLLVYHSTISPLIARVPMWPHLPCGLARLILQADADSGYDRNFVDGHIIEVGCLAHYRRRSAEKRMQLEAKQAELDVLAREVDRVLRESGGPDQLTRYVYNADDSLQQIAHGALTNHQYTYDAFGQRSALTGNITATALDYRYSYDALNRLTEVRNSASQLIEGYSYDPLDNRTTRVSGGTTYYSLYDAANQLKEVRSGSASGTLVAGFIHDAAGNLTQKCEGGAIAIGPTSCSGATVTTLTYDALEQLTQAAKTGLATQSYTYDHAGRRVHKDDGATSRKYRYSGDNIVAEYTTTWTAADVVYSHGLATDEPLQRLQGTTAGYYHQDGINSAIMLTDSSGAAINAQVLDAWGNLTAGTALPRFGYTGREPDETGLIYYRARYYDPIIGRFIQRDPVGMAVGINFYAYVHSNPINFIDPFGLTAAEPGTRSEGYWATTACAPACTVIGGFAADSTAGVAAGMVPGYQGLQQGRQDPGGFQSITGLPATTPPSLAQQIITAVGGYAAGVIGGISNLIDSPSQAWQNFQNNVFGGLIFSEAPTPQEILMPGGQPIGQPGTSSGIRVMQGGAQGAQDLFGQLSQGGTVTDNPRYPGTQVQLPNNSGIIGIRPQSSSGDIAIDVNIPGLNGIVDKIHFP